MRIKLDGDYLGKFILECETKRYLINEVKTVDFFFVAVTCVLYLQLTRMINAAINSMIIIIMMLCILLIE
jgi:hypothetical protein